MEMSYFLSWGYSIVKHINRAYWKLLLRLYWVILTSFTPMGILYHTSPVTVYTLNTPFSPSVRSFGIYNILPGITPPPPPSSPRPPPPGEGCLLLQAPVVTSTAPPPLTSLPTVP